MYKVKIDKYKNRMNFMISGEITDKSSDEIMHEVEYHATQLRYDFDVLIDVRFFKSTSEYVLKHITSIQESLKRKGSRYGIFAIGSSTYALKVVAKFAHYQEEQKHLFFVPTMMDAETKLDELIANLNK